MPRILRCIVPRCNATAGSVCYHTLPKNPALLSQWLQAIGVEHADLPKTAVVCSAHFTPDCYNNFSGFEMGFYKKLSLKPGAIPTAMDVGPSPIVTLLPRATHAASIMSKQRGWHGICSVVGCTDQHKTLHRLPASEDRRTEWIKFIFNGKVPATVGKNLCVCSNHFSFDCFTNLGQYKARLATKLFLKEESVPTVRYKIEDKANAGTSRQIGATMDVGCQTDPPLRANSVATQLSMKTLQPHFRSKGVQATVSCKDFGVGGPIPSRSSLKSTAKKRATKRRCVVLEEEHPFEGISSMLASQGLDATNKPADPVTASQGLNATNEPADSVTATSEPSDLVTASQGLDATNGPADPVTASQGLDATSEPADPFTASQGLDATNEPADPITASQGLDATNGPADPVTASQGLDATSEPADPFTASQGLDATNEPADPITASQGLDATNGPADPVTASQGLDATSEPADPVTASQGLDVTNGPADPVTASQGLDATSEPADVVTAMNEPADPDTAMNEPADPETAMNEPADSDRPMTESKDMPGLASSPTHKIKKFIAYERCIMELFEVCPVCQCACEVQSQRIGTFLSVEQLCPHCQFSKHWKSQPLLGSTPAGNLQLSAAVYVSGASFFKLEKIFKAMELEVFQYETFRRHARMFIEPAVVNKWKTSQDVILQRLSKEDKVIVGGDMRAGCPGQFGSYTTMDLKTNTVVDIQLLRSNEVGGSYHMEKEGLQRSLILLDARGVTLDCIVTDRDPQIQKFLRENNIDQFYDVWHMEKSISKELEKIGKMKDCEKLQRWMRSIRNHIYWTAASSTTGPERVAKWTSILNHVRDIHTHEDPIFPQCLHPLHQTRDQSEWLAAATPAFSNLKKVLTNKRILKDIEKLSPHHQTSYVEDFHSAILRFAPRNINFPFLGMLCRLYLAALFYNENANRPQATTSAGEPLFKVHFPKGRKGECRAKPVKTEPTFRYVDDLLDLIFEKVFVDPAPYMDEVLKIPIPEDLSLGEAI